MTTLLENTYVEPELRSIETSRFELRREKESYHKEQLDVEEDEADKFTSLVESIRELGILQPIYVIESGPDKYEVVDGGRRLRAAKLLKMQRVPSMVFRGESEVEIRKRALVANIHRKDLNNEEKGEGLADYYKSGGISPKRVISYLTLLKNRRYQSGSGKNYNVIFDNENEEQNRRFLDLYKRIGFSASVQYQWLSYVIFVPAEIRRKVETEELSRADRELLVQKEIRDKPAAQKALVEDLSSYNKQMERAKKTESGDIYKAKVSEIKEEKERRVKEYLPEKTEKKYQKQKDPFTIYGNINGCINRLWTALTDIKEMPVHVDDLLVDHIKPSREYFKEYVSGIKKSERVQQYNWLTMLEKVMNDRIKILDEASS